MKIFEKFALRKKNLNETEKFFFEKSIFCKFFKTNCIFLCQICIQNVFSFHLIYILSMQVKNDEFSKIVDQKLENLRGQTRLLRRHLTANLCNLGQCSKTPELYNDASFHLEPSLVDLGDEMRQKQLEKGGGHFPSHPLDRPKSPP